MFLQTINGETFALHEGVLHGKKTRDTQTEESRRFYLFTKSPCTNTMKYIPATIPLRETQGAALDLISQSSLY